MHAACPDATEIAITKLSDSQLLVLSAAAQRDDGHVVPLPASLLGGSATQVVGALLTRD